MKLNVFERIMLLDIMPKHSDYAGIKELRRFREVCGLSADEAKTVGENTPDGGFHIIPEKGMDLVKDVPISEWATSTIQNTLRKMDVDLALSPEQLTLYEKFITFYGI